jgi:hypothetical protein
MVKRFFTFGSTVTLIFLIFVIFFFESISHWGGVAQTLRVAIIAYFLLHFSFVIRNIIIDRRDKEEGNLSDVIVKRAIEKRKIRMLERRGFIR